MEESNPSTQNKSTETKTEKHMENSKETAEVPLTSQDEATKANSEAPANSLERATLLFGKDAIDTLESKTVVVAGCGGVGSFAIEALARSGVGRLVLIDKDVVEASNLNRQLCALTSTVGQAKTEILKERIARIRPQTEVIAYTGWYDKQLNDWLLEQKPDYVLDCIDSMRSKQDLILFALDNQIPVISSMGMARRKDPTKIEIMELEKTTNDPMAKVMRNWKRKNRIRKKIMTVCSTELPIPMEPGKSLPSAIFVPASAGLAMASYCVQDLMNPKPEKKTDFSIQPEPMDPAEMVNRMTEKVNTMTEMVNTKGETK